MKPSRENILLEKVRNYAKQYHMLEADETVVIGLSGGADSVCLLFMLLELQKEIPFHIAALHVNHGVRMDAAQDACYAELLCRENGVPFTLVEEDVPAVAEILGISTEEAGRQIRYHCFGELLKYNGNYGKIAVAHHRNDRAETILFHLFRGTGLAGAAGIRPVRDRIIRPLLCLTREEIEEYLAEREITYCIDSTNEEDTYTRNKIRHFMIPFAEREISEQSIAHLCSAGEMFGEADDYIRRQAGKVFAECVTCASGEKTDGTEAVSMLQIRVNAFLKADEFLQKYVILQTLEKLTESRKDISSVHVMQIMALFQKESGKQVLLPYGLRAVREFDVVKFYKQEQDQRQEKKWKTQQKPVPVKIEGKPEGKFGFDGKKSFIMRVFPRNKSQRIPEKRYTKWFDYDKIVECLIIRNREIGDYLTINDTFGKKSIKEYMIQEKIPQTKRDKLPLIAEGNHILWVVGHRISTYYRVTDTTKQILEITLEDQENNE
ncbi:MAG: tRNA lysidine(34) synthetase TilS [Lachnospiraceae bacterium]|nr:tRNA lysidine(34) synthetase TilS [Lachnospiraceae bacterium]